MALFDFISSLASPLPDAIARPGTGVPSGPSQTEGGAAAPGGAQFAALLQALGGTRETGQPGAAVSELLGAPSQPSADQAASNADGDGPAAATPDSIGSSPSAARQAAPFARLEAPDSAPPRPERLLADIAVPAIGQTTAAAAAPAPAGAPIATPVQKAGETADRLESRHIGDAAAPADARTESRPSAASEAAPLEGRFTSEAAETQRVPHAAAVPESRGEAAARPDRIVTAKRSASAPAQPALAQGGGENRLAAFDAAAVRPQPRAPAKTVPVPGTAPEGAGSALSPPAQTPVQPETAARSGQPHAVQSVQPAAGNPAHIGALVRARGGTVGLAGRNPSRGAPDARLDAADASPRSIFVKAQAQAQESPSSPPFARAEGAAQPQPQLPATAGSLPPAGGQGQAAAPGAAALAAGNGGELTLPAGGTGDAGAPLGQAQGHGPAPAPAGSAAPSATPQQPPPTPQPPASPAMQVGLSIGKLAAEGSRRFTLRLDPPELGRVEVRLELAQDGHLRAQIRADSRETLDLLQRDSRMLERALGDAGLKTDSGSLNFSLNQQGQNAGPGFGQNRDGAPDPSGNRPGETAGAGADAPEDPGPDSEIRFTAADPESVDIRV